MIILMTVYLRGGFDILVVVSIRLPEFAILVTGMVEIIVVFIVDDEVCRVCDKLVAVP